MAAVERENRRREGQRKRKGSESSGCCPDKGRKEKKNEAMHSAWMF